MKEKLINLLKCVIVFILFFCLSSFINYICSLIGINLVSNNKDYGYYDSLIELIFALIVCLFYYKELKEDKDKLKTRKGIISDLVKYFIIFMIVKIFSGVVESIISLILGYNLTESENQNIIVEITKEAPILMLIATTILAPIVEEGIFRLSLRKVIKNNYLFILISGSIFGFMHIFPTNLSLSIALTQSIVYVAMGFYLAYIYVETDNIWINILLHGINNFISMLAILMVMI